MVLNELQTAAIEKQLESYVSSGLANSMNAVRIDMNEGHSPAN
jgi:hypothetical protein